MCRFLILAICCVWLALPSHATETISIASFNVKWIGYYPERDDEALAKLVKDFDIVVIQELVSPPYEATFPDGKAVKPDPQSAEFFDAMTDEGFSFVLSPEDTGPGEKNHNTSASTEWFVAFYKPEEVGIASDLPNGFIAKDLTAHPDYARVPYAFAFRVPNGPDFVLISVHLQPDASKAAKKRRKHELSSIAKWIDKSDNAEEKDFIILGDTNIQSCAELETAIPSHFVALNDECRDTVPAPPSRPYDQVFYHSDTTGNEIDTSFDLKVIDLVKEMEAEWEEDFPNEAYPGSPYKSKKFPKYYSDHNPVHFRILVVEDDD
jgi:hypothetical protein